jgi:pSer/pThr/pTyr-binding forkhead associated (FHA) protein
MPTLGVLVTTGNGDPIPLYKRELTVGRLDKNDIVLRFHSVSAAHCQLTAHDSRWYIKDLSSANGIQVNGKRCQESRLDPGDRFAIAKHEYVIQYSPDELLDDFLRTK